MSGPKPAESEAARSTPLGLYDQPRPPSVTAIEIVAVALSILWLGGALLFFMLVPGDGDTSVDSLRFLMTMLAIFMPVGMIWVAATAARASRVMREESHRLQAAIDAIRQAYLAQNQRGALSMEPSVQKKLDEIVEATRKAETALAIFSSVREREAAAVPRAMAPAPSAPAPTGEDGQTSLELGTPAEALVPPPPASDFIRALNFPETAEDEEGFAALRRALRDRKSAQLIQASQDVLTLLSQDGIYMDDLRPDMARADVWRQFAKGVRGRAVAPLGGVRDRSSLALTAARMKQDPIFRDAAHHFLRKFDHMFAEFEAEASDADIQALGDTRTARAFMLLGRVAGTFD
ncbi:hypothetical protein [Marinibacterium sp. SX1]|uniref:hypothetical protein n=1 Tax=Marinibacterium sp. SX1 TaxID=3388424 RepID=UPI003D169B39